MSEPTSETDRLREMIEGAKRIVAFTGAGISTESGIPDFRSPGGIWTKYQPIYFDDFMASEEMRRESWRRRGMRIPNILDILFRGAMLRSSAGERDIADNVEFYLRPPLRGIGLLDFKTLDMVEASAYEYALRALESWPFRRARTA